VKPEPLICNPKVAEVLALDLKVEIEDRGVGVTVVTPRGTVELANCDELREKRKEVIAQPRRGVVVDMDDVDFIDSAGLGVLVGGMKRAAQKGIGFAIACNNHRHKNLFKMTKLDLVFKLYDSLDEAVNSLKSG